MQPNYYDFNVRFPIYETNILNLTNARHEDADFTLHENLERMILETGDEMQKSTNVKAETGLCTKLILVSNNLQI